VALAVTAAVVPFPAGVVAAAPVAPIVGVVLAAGQTLPRAELTLFIGSDPTAAADYRPVMLNGNPFKLPIGSGGYFQLPVGLIPTGANIQVGLSNFGGAAATVNLITT
jgi:hypothetical protein